MLGIVAAGVLWQLWTIWAARLRYPFDLEWMEGGMLIHAWRMQRGLPIYVEPSAEFIPFVYPPGFSAALVALAEVFGLDYSTGRALSLFSTGIAAAAIVFAVRRFTRAWLPAFVGALVYLGCYSSSGLFYDLVRSDALAMALLAWSIALAFERDPRAALGSALLLAAAATVKLQTAVFGLPLMLCIWARDGRPAAIRFALAAAFPVVAFAVFMQWRTDGLFLRWVIAAPASHGMVWQRFFPGTPAELGGHLPIVLGVLAGWAVLRAAGELPGVRRRRFLGAVAALAIAGALTALGIAAQYTVTRFEAALGVSMFAALAVASVVWLRARGRAAPASTEAVFVISLGAMALFSCAMSRAHLGGYVNVLMPLHWLLALAFGCVLAQMPTHWPRVGTLVASVLAISQLGLQGRALDAGRFAPDEGDRVAGERLVEVLRELPGPILSPFAPWLAVQAGYPPSLHQLSISENSMPGSAFPSTRERIRAAVDSAYWPIVVAGNRPIGFGVEERYELMRHVESAGHELWPRSGFPVRPEAIMSVRR